MTLGDLCELIYPIALPPWASAEQWDRHAHLDLARLSRPELLRERDRLRLRLTLDDRPGRWLLARLAHIEEALRER